MNNYWREKTLSSEVIRKNMAKKKKQRKKQQTNKQQQLQQQQQQERKRVWLSSLLFLLGDGCGKGKEIFFNKP